jgi:hypothetical protein
MTQAPTTLGEKLAAVSVATQRTERKPTPAPAPKPAPKPEPKQSSKIPMLAKEMFYAGLLMALLLITAAIPLVWLMSGAQLWVAVILVAMCVPLLFWVVVARARDDARATSDNPGWPTSEPITKRKSGLFANMRPPPAPKPHSLLLNDRQGFMKHMRLDAKTAIFDGSNVYHFGNEHGLDAQPLGMLAHRLREEGYRIVCFFDANIFYTLQEHGAFTKDTRHSVDTLNDIFGLAADEIYVVPSGIQADRYILNALKYLPISFAVTNDRFRDFAKQYPEVMKGQWRKGVVISKGELRLTQHKLQTPIRMDQAV